MKVNNFDLPSGLVEIIDILDAKGFESYAVGGCIRDSILKIKPKDWDISTQASPVQIKEIFKNYDTISIGEKYGTIAIKSKIDNIYYETTTYRIDGEYIDNRRPSSVKYTNDLKSDLARRDFTINAMAYNHKSGLIDFFGGQDSIKKRIIKTVGSPKTRFSEDYLRIMRAYRFATNLDYNLDSKTRLSALNLKKNLNKISIERLQFEFSSIILSNNFNKINIFFEDISDILFPEFYILKGFEQNNIYHIYDVFYHSLKVLENTRAYLPLRLSAIFHDTGKYYTKSIDKNGIFHFYNHTEYSYKIAKESLKKMRYSNQIYNKTIDIIKNHDIDLPDNDVSARFFLNKFDIDLAILIIDFQIADNSAKNLKNAQKKLDSCILAKKLIDNAIKNNEPYKISHLLINGDDILKNFDIPQSSKIGQILNKLLIEIIKEPKLNNKIFLLDMARQLCYNS